MKRIFEHPPEEATGRQYWRSLEQLTDSPGFEKWVEEEFPSGGPFGNEADGFSRRHFLKIMGASMALAGVGFTGCRRPEAHIVAYNQGPEWVIPGKALKYATSMPRRREFMPLVATTHEGRPTKVEGNPMVPGYNGGTDGFAQGSILDLYDPDRLRRFKNRDADSSLEAFLKYLEERRSVWGDNEGAGLAFLLEESNSPTRERLRRQIKEQFPQATWAVYEPLDDRNLRQAVRAAFGPGHKLQYRYDQADVTVALDADILGTDEGGLSAVKGFADGRRLRSPDDEMNRLYAVESRFSITGGVADHRLRVPSSQITAFGVALARAVNRRGSHSALEAVLGAMEIDETAVAAFDEAWVDSCADDLVAHYGRSVVVAGLRQTPQLHALVLALNLALGARGQTIEVVADPIEEAATLNELARKIGAGQITDLFVLGGNPAYNAPADMEWEKVQGQVEHVVRWSLAKDETSRRCEWQIPAAHYLESWGDGRAHDGTLVPVQPMILPLFGGLGELDLLNFVAGNEALEGPELVKETFSELTGTDQFDEDWSSYLRQGYFEGTGYEAAESEVNSRALARYAEEAPPVPRRLSDQEFEVVFSSDYSMDDGRYANNGWMQECPDPVTRLTWENAALMSPKSAAALGLAGMDVRKRVPMVTLQVGGRRLENVPVLVAPGHAEQSITLPLGYGRLETGYVGKESGVDAYRLRTAENLYFATGVSVVKESGLFVLATTQDHHSMEGRHLVREGTLDQYRRQPDFAQLVGTDGLIVDGILPPNRSLHENPKLDSQWQWAMSIDLTSCIGCNACVLACQSENNIPIVGKEQVVHGREMHWIRNDRYFSTVVGYDEEPQMLIQPIPCMMCENAPCETVCPVNATVHSEDGLNVMTYNRCIGTRYCANNCPYKVRRFNYFDYNERPLDKLYLGPLAPKGMADTLKMQKNPNVTVRMRGVMEKCTYCVQRIEDAKITAKVRARDSADVVIPTDSVRTACQTACPAEAIVFGDINDPGSRISKLKKESRDYVLLKYLNIRPRTSYLARINNPNPGMPDADRLSETTASHVSRGTAARV